VDGHLRTLFRTHLREGWDWQSVENWGVGSGVPDANFCGPGGVEGWVEFKAARGWRVALAPTQVAWMERRARVKGRTFIAVRKDQSLWLYPGACARELAAGDIRSVPYLGEWHGGPTKWDWRAVGALLVS